MLLKSKLSKPLMKNVSLNYNIQKNLIIIKKFSYSKNILSNYKNVTPQTVHNPYNPYILKILKLNSSISYNNKNHNANLYTENIKHLNNFQYLKKSTLSKNFNLFSFDIYKKLNNFDTDKLDDTFVSSDNFRYKNTKLPIKVNKGMSTSSTNTPIPEWQKYVGKNLEYITQAQLLDRLSEK